jgi:hypothetical protein
MCSQRLPRTGVWISRVSNWHVSCTDTYSTWTSVTEIFFM